MGGECELCPGDGRVANAEQSLCESCFPGLEPMDDLSGCQGCTYNMFSQFGYGCLDCAAPAVVNSDRTICSPCAPGTGPVGGSDSSDWVGANCEGITYSPSGECLDCSALNVVNDGHTTCTAVREQRRSFHCLSIPRSHALNGWLTLNPLALQCLPGQQPNEDRTACVDCDQLDGVTFSASGAECLVCGGTQAVNGIPGRFVC